MHLLPFVLYTAVALGSLFFIGFPVAALLSTSPLNIAREKVWLLAPFLGLAVIVLVLQNLVYLSVPIETSYIYVWMGAAVLWVWLFASGGLKAAFPLPWRILVVAFVVYLIHSLGLLLIGPDNYVARGWYDQFSYVSVTQFLMEHRLPHVDLQELMLQPSALRAVLFTFNDRIGETMFPGFIASTLFGNAKSSFEPAILMMPLLVVLAVYQVALQCSLSKKSALFVAALGGCLPSLALMHLESFLSQALTTPLLLLWPVILHATFENPNWKKIFCAALLLATVTSIYVEYYVVFFALTGIYVLFNFYRNRNANVFWWMLAMVVVGLFLNVGFLKTALMIAQRSAAGRSGLHIYPWLNSILALHWLWIGDLSMMLRGWRKIFFNIASPTLLFMACFGFAITFLRQKNAVSGAVLILVLLPIALACMGLERFGYQYYKLLISMSPLLPLGIVLTCQMFASPLLQAKPYWREMGYYFFAPVGFIICSATLCMILTSVNPASLAIFKRSVGYKLMLPDSIEVQEKLAQLSNQDILISWTDSVRHGEFINAWLAYYARNNRVWLNNPRVAEENLKQHIATFNTLPDKFLLLMPASSPVVTGAATQKIWGNQTYILLKTTKLDLASFPAFVVGL